MGATPVFADVEQDTLLIDPEQINSVVALFENSRTQIGTLVKKINSSDELFDPNVVKVVLSNDSNALYFSRNTIPMLRGIEEAKWLENFMFFKHIGIYGYRTNVLKVIANMPDGKLEQAEKLEQLRWLENGIPISVNITDYESIAIDTAHDLIKLDKYS